MSTPTQQHRRTTTGIRTRHSRSCPANEEGGTCNQGKRDGCTPSYEAFVFSRRDGCKIRKTFPTMGAAKGWRADATSKLARGKLSAPTKRTLREAGDEFMEGAEAGSILNRSREPYKPSVLRGYRNDLETYIYPDLGAHRLSDVRRGDVQALVDQLAARGLSGSKVRNALNPVQVIYRRAIRREEVTDNPTLDLELPPPGNRRERAATVDEAEALLGALPTSDRALWETAFFAGLRRGELRAIRWSDIDLDANEIHVRRGWDDIEGEIEPKSKKGSRTVPIAGDLRRRLLEHKAATGRRGDELVFASDRGGPFTPSNIRNRAVKAWNTANTKRAEAGLPPLVPIGLHECRHTFVSLMAAAGIPLERIGDYVGHSTTYMVDRYRHLLEGQREHDAALFDALITGARSGAQGAQSSTATR